jgi:hypothetical protein
MRFCFAFLLSLLLIACHTKPLKPGRTKFTGSIGKPAIIESTQSENPQTPTTQDYEKTRETSLDLPAGSVIQEVAAVAPGETNAARTSIVLAQASRQVVKEAERTRSSIGAAQKDTAREVAARFKAAAPLLFIGIVCLLGAGAFIYFKWPTPGIIAGITGIVLISLYFMLPSITPMTWLFIALGVLASGVVVLLVFYSHNKGELDKNKNGIPDFLERSPKPPNPS